jgi:hypothetical protein
MAQDYTQGETLEYRSVWKSLATARITNAAPFLVASLIFLAPNAVMALAFHTAAAILVLVGCAGAGILLWREGARSDLLRAPADVAQLAVCLAFGLALCLLGGEGHVFQPKSDWLTRDAVLADLVREGLVVLYRHEGQEYLLRAPLGMYLLPAMVGRFLGLHAAHLALLAQNSILVGAVAYFTGAIAQVRRAPMILLLLAFSGLDIVGIAAAELSEIASGGAFMFFGHNEWWSLYFWPGQFQYSSLVTQIFWVPNHAAPGWWLAALILLHLRRAVSFPALIASFGPLVIWSPLAVVGAAPFLVLFAARQALRSFLSPAFLASVALTLCFLPIAVYLVIDAGAVPHEWLILREGFARQYLIFLLIEIPQAALVLYCFRHVAAEDRPAFWLALAVLLILPVYSFGPCNDLMMRASIPALFILAFHFARIVVLTRSAGGVVASVASTLVLVGAATPIIEIRTAIDRSYAISDCDLLTTSLKLAPSQLPANYLARIEKTPAWLFDLSAAPAPLTAADRQCWPDHPVLEEKMR